MSGTDQKTNNVEDPMTTLDTATAVTEHNRWVSAVPAFRPVSPVPTYLGVALASAGFVLIAVTWGLVAPLKDVAKQLPYVVSGGLTGVGLILVGMTVVSVSARRREAALRERQSEQLGRALDQLTAALDRLSP